MDKVVEGGMTGKCEVAPVLFVDCSVTGKTTAKCLYAELGALWASPVFFFEISLGYLSGFNSTMDLFC